MNTTATAPYVIVVKNAATLKNLNLKLDEIRINEDNEIVDRPMLLIDDEADNATIDLRSGLEIRSKENHQRILINFYILRKIQVIMIQLLLVRIRTI